MNKSEKKLNCDPLWAALEFTLSDERKKLIYRAFSMIMIIWFAILMIYNFEINPIIGFCISYVMWRVVQSNIKKEKINNKKLVLFGIIIFLSGNYRVEEYLLSIVVMFTVFHIMQNFINRREELKQENQEILKIIYIAITAFYTLRMIFIFDVSEILMPLHKMYLSIMEILIGNQPLMWAIIAILIILNVVLIWKSQKQTEIPLMIGMMAGMFGIEDMTAIIVMSVALNRLREIKIYGDEKVDEHQKFVQ